MEHKPYQFDTLSIHGGHTPDTDTLSRAVPIYQTTAYNFHSTEHARRLFSLEEEGNIYTRLQNPTQDVLEKRVAALDGGVGALAVASGHAAISLALLTLAGAGDEIIASNQIYGGAINLFAVTLKRMGITVKLINPDDFEAIEQAVTDKTKAIFVESVGNPNANVVDLLAISAIAKKYKIPFIVDTTFVTPYLQRPVEFGADIVIHSATKFLGGHGTAMCGIIVDLGTFDWKDNPRFLDFNQPDVSYHGVVFADLGPGAFIARVRTLALRDLGPAVSPFNAFLILQGIETLSLRMERHVQNADRVAGYLAAHPKVTAVNYPRLKGNQYYEAAQKYLPLGIGSVFTFELAGGREAGGKFIDSLKLFSHVANVGDVRSLVVHPATTTHSQLNEEQLKAAGITPGTIRLSVGLEDINDLIDDLEQAIQKATV
jgi:O-acetylhomoserine (thiol)-lyase